MMLPTTKRKRNVLSIEDKLTIINRLEKGETGAALGKIFNVGNATISEIKRSKSVILNFASKLDSTDSSKRRKTMKKASDEKLDDAVYLWFLQRRREGEFISGPLLCEKALQLNQELAGPSEFKASTGWLKNFRSRHGIREFKIRGEALSGDAPTVEAFKETFLKMVEEEGFSKDDVYNADETSLNWKTLPRNSLVSRREKAASSLKVGNERITVMVCANASGQHVLPLLVVGKSKNPRCFNGVTCLPVEYKAQKNAWMDSNTFLDWFIHHFIPSVKGHRSDQEKCGKVLLLIDKAPSHPPLEQLNAIDENFIVKFLPPNVTAILQPMDQGVTDKLKRMYKMQFLLRLLLPKEGEESIVEILNKLNLKDCCYMLVDAWNSLSSESIKKAWHKLWSDAEESVVHEQGLNEDVREIVTLFQVIPGFFECGQDDAEAWLNNEAADPGYQNSSEEEMIALAQNEECTDDNQDDCDDEEPQTGSKPTHEEAFTALETAMAWCEQQSECNSTEIAILEKLRDLAAKKKQSMV